MLALRLKFRLTQAGLAQQLGISRRALGAWEAGSSYPRIEQFKRLVALGIKQHAFSTGHEFEEVQTLWQASHQKTLLDEVWLTELLRSSPTQTILPVDAKRKKS